MCRALAMWLIAFIALRCSTSSVASMIARPRNQMLTVVPFGVVQGTGASRLPAKELPSVYWSTALLQLQRGVTVQLSETEAAQGARCCREPVRRA
jgi:hypothetical protein